MRALFLITMAGLCILSGCVTTKDQRGLAFGRAAAASGNALAQGAVSAIYGGSEVEDYRLPDGWLLGWAPVDQYGNWIEGVAAYYPFIYPTAPNTAAAYTPVGFSPLGLMPAPSIAPPVPPRPIALKPLREEPVRPGLEGVIGELEEAVGGSINE